ncbi:MAG: glutathione S-transferase family protein [Pseudomonadota bacterium]
MAQKFTLISHVLCPYVQRAAIVLAEKNIGFERVDIDLANKPDWFLKISPLGKTPVLLVDGQPIFESAVICEYLEEVTSSKLHPPEALQRAQHRGWMEFGSATLNSIAGLYAAPDDVQLAIKVADIRAKFLQLEDALGAGPFFEGDHFSMVDAVFGPVFRYFDTFDAIEDFGFFAATPKVRAWRAALAARPSVRSAVREDYADLLRAFLLKRQSALSARMAHESTY